MSDTAIVKPEVSQMQAALLDITGRTAELVVRDRETCLTAKTAQRDVRAYLRDVHSKLDPFVEAAKRNLATARDELNRWLDPAQAIDDALARKVKDYETQERLAAEAEEKRVNDERRRVAALEAEERRKVAAAQAETDRKAREKEIKAQQAAGELKAREAEKQRKQAAADAEAAKERADAEAKASVAAVQDVTVKPDIPTVAGVPSRRNWRWEVVDESKIPDSYWMLNDLKIGAETRALKEKTAIPGIRVYQE